MLVAQRTLYQAQVDLAVSEANVTIDLVALYKALGVFSLRGLDLAKI